MNPFSTINYYFRNYSKYPETTRIISMRTVIVDGVSFSVGDKVTVKNGVDFGKVGSIYKFYKADDIVSVSVQFADNEYGMYQLHIIEKV